MQIHFYQQWDKQNVQENGQPDEPHKSPFSNKGMILLICMSILFVFWATLTLFADREGQAVVLNQHQAGQSLAVAKPDAMLYTVKSGDTLWAIAGLYYPERSREEAVQLIKEKNGFNGATIQAGQTILLP
ncbi:LysM peptidoglycan-binding domain-containing protein [Ammoniphilus sp. YIM 78166]|uniref:LysM peptidoglycan-binding domain-containing protein n=1 Tax=Ammoniphilus sp. YIM 78166 TaxID=1644106 RepID=UPI00106F76B2|nr:LysM peptidoglycan-binding domain-containing protein [Ammoniphilus sp. YIM 78166]